MKRLLVMIAVALLSISLCGCVATLTDKTELVGNKSYNQRMDIFEEEGGSVAMYQATFDVLYDSAEKDRVFENIKSTIRINLENIGYPDAIVDSDNKAGTVTVRIPELDKGLYDGTIIRSDLFGTVEADNSCKFSRLSLEGKTDKITRYNIYETNGGCLAIYKIDDYIGEEESYDVLSGIRWTVIKNLSSMGYPNAVTAIENNNCISVLFADVSQAEYANKIDTQTLFASVNYNVSFVSVTDSASRNDRIDAYEVEGGSVAIYKFDNMSSYNQEETDKILRKTSWTVLQNLKNMGYSNAYVDILENNIRIIIPGVNKTYYDSTIYRSDLFNSVNEPFSRISVDGKESVESRTASFEEKGGSVATYETDMGGLSDDEKKNHVFLVKHNVIANLSNMGYGEAIVLMTDDGILTVKVPEVREPNFDSTINSAELFTSVPGSFRRTTLNDQLSAEEIFERDKGFVGAFAEILGKEKEEIDDDDYRSVRLIKLETKDGRVHVYTGDYSVASAYNTYVRNVINNPNRANARELEEIFENCKTASFQINDGFKFTELGEFEYAEVVLLDNIPIESADIEELSSLRCGKFISCGLTSVRAFDELNLYSIYYLDLTGNNISDWSALKSIDDKVVTGRRSGEYVVLSEPEPEPEPESESVVEEEEPLRDPEVTPTKPTTPSTPATPAAPAIPKAYGKFNFGMTKDQAKAVISGASYSYGNMIYLEDYSASYANEDTSITGNQNCSYIELTFNDSGLYKISISGDYVTEWNNANSMYSSIERYYGVRRSFSGETGQSTWYPTKNGVSMTVTAKIEHHEGSGYIVILDIIKR